MNFFKKLFGGDDEVTDTRGNLTHPNQLRRGDIVKFGFLPQDDLSRQSFEVIAVNSYDFEGEQSYSLTLKGEAGGRFWLSVSSEDGEEYLAISQKLTRSDVGFLFGSDAFAEVFDEGLGMVLNRVDVRSDLEQWIAESYVKEEDCSKGYYHEGDFRDRNMPRTKDNASSLDYYLLMDENEEAAIEIEVYEGGETEVSAVVYHELSAIDELWPGELA